MKPLSRLLKRAIDVAGSTVGLAVAGPVLASAALGIRATMGSPILFVQERTGQHGEPFKIYKLRTMVQNAASLDGGRQIRSGDPLVTPLGRLLRNTSIDELPQLLNILKGDMSFVGPRPTLKVQTDAYDDEQAKRLDVPPGLTGWAQIHGNALLTWDERIERDVWYVDHASLRLDLEILLKTVGVVLRNAK